MTAKVNLLIDQGATFYQLIQLDNQNGDPLQVTFANNEPMYTPSAQMRKSYQALNAVSFDTTLSNGQLTLALPANVTSNVAAGRYVYDAKLVAEDNTSYRIVEGIATVKPQATKV